MTFIPGHRTIPSQALHLKPVTKKQKKIQLRLPSKDGRQPSEVRNQDSEIPTPSAIISSINSPDKLEFNPIDADIIDIYLPGKDAWDAIKQRAITNQLDKLGIETAPTPTEQKYSDSFVDPPSKHSKSLSFNSSESNLLDFKMDKFFNNSPLNLEIKPPSRFGSHHSSSLSLNNFNTTNLSPGLSSPSSYFPNSPRSPGNYLNIPDFQQLSRKSSEGPSSHHPSSLADVEEEQEEEDVDNHVKVEDVDNNVPEQDILGTQDVQPADQDANTSIIPDEAPQLPPPSFQELSRGFGYEVESDEEQMQDQENNHKKTLSGFTMRSSNQVDEDQVDEDAHVEHIDDDVKQTVDDSQTDHNTTDTEDHAFNYELQKKDIDDHDQQENTIKPAAALNSALKPTVAEFIPSIPFKDSTNVYDSSSFKFGLKQSQEQEEPIEPVQASQPMEIPNSNPSTKRDRAPTVESADNWSGFDVNSDNGGDYDDMFSNPSEEDRALQNRFNKRMMSNNAFQFGGLSGSSQLNRKKSLSATAPAFEPGNFTFKSELSMPTADTFEVKENDTPAKRGRLNSDTSPNQSIGWIQPFEIKREPVNEDVYEIHQTEEAPDSRITLQDVYYKLEQLSVNLGARNDLSKDDVVRLLETDRGLILEGLERLDEATQHTSSMDRLSLLADLLAGLKPQISSLKPDENALALKLSEAITPGIQTLVDLASDKKETAAIITEELARSTIFSSIKDQVKEMLDSHAELYKEHSNNLSNTQAEIFTNASSLQAKLGDLPDGITDATNALLSATNKLDNYSNIPAELTKLREYVNENSELRNEISKSQSMHGRLRSEKDRIIDKLKVVEEERDFSKTEADLSRQAARKVESDLVKIEATNGSLIESLNGMSIKVSQAEEQVSDLLEQKQAWYAADRDYQIRVKELEMQLEMLRKERQNDLKTITEDKKRTEEVHKSNQELSSMLHESRAEVSRVSSEFEQLSRNSMQVNQELMTRNQSLEISQMELDKAYQTSNMEKLVSEQRLHEVEMAYGELQSKTEQMESRSSDDKALLEEATSTIERLYQEMSTKQRDIESLNEQLEQAQDGRRTPTNNKFSEKSLNNYSNGVTKSAHAPSTPISPAYSSASKFSVTSTATYQADDGWFYNA
ncbi:hypothetical protein WALSEDRAFT_56057 [Wallemia mellicola CBS 633.66]|uniref:Uncharacterized protein n=1 Tax=Wallemia mellicola (strain ATCC MYA-4683 / CBS 633.66) TaxID=671144 RepID=I4YJX4_WALMC|nr:hypothetical protein WALSEDRAFT_56057 [Wallemia mellicola CBS 633.66]EIM24266.1 hypothetical protein WALSEDRAFT_56057 [Wallemia mellicola CBS 633.66]|eukprot:XP_006956082.1 hypothetical protein WALSEDRAFT_56057 [Wallemia mellicola CBS 633.66]